MYVKQTEGSTVGYIEGSSRYQTRVMCLDEMVAGDSRVRIIDRFVDGIDLKALGFTNCAPALRGRPPYPPGCMVKLYMFGYEKKVRSSRNLEEFCRTNIEAMWLLDELHPDFKTIADFRKDNTKAFVALFSEFANFLDSLGLYGKRLVAIDGTKIRASSSKKKHYSKKKLTELIEYNEKKAREYLATLDSADGAEETDDALIKAEGHVFRAEEYTQLLDGLECSGEDAISLTDPDARMMKTEGFGVGMAYNIQAAVDGENHLVSTFSVSTSAADQGQLCAVAQKTIDERGKPEDGEEDTTFLSDGGYYDGDDLKKCEEAEIDVVVACPGERTYKSRGEGFQSERFLYNSDTDSYTCPKGEVLTCHSKPTTKDKKYHNAKACRNCEHKDQCVPENSNKRIMIRRPNSDVLDRAQAKYDANRELYKLRQQIVEHVFGTVKRTMDSGYFLLRTKEKVEAEIALTFTCYNLKRAHAICGFDKIMEALKRLLVQKAKLLPHTLFQQCMWAILAVMETSRGKLGYDMPLARRAA